MKNPFKEEDHSGILIAGVIIGSILAGAFTYLYVKKRSLLKAEAAELKAHAQDYLKKKLKKARKHKTDTKELDVITE